jgi:hypothetical protein
MKNAQQKQIIDLNYVDHFDYKVKFITKTDVLKGYMDITIVLMFKIVIYQKKKKKRGEKVFIGNPKDRVKSSLDSRKISL